MGSVTSACVVCGGPVSVPVLGNTPDYQFGVQWSGEIKACEKCDLVQQSPMPSLEEALAFYPETYAHYHPDKSRLRLTLLRFYFRSLVKLFSNLGAAPGQRLVDIGCASGEKTYHLRESLQLDAVGIEPNATAAGRARDTFGLEVIEGTFPTPEIPPESVDFIYINHVIEHVPDPVGLLRDIHTALKPGGWVVGETENIGSPSARLFGEYWSLLHVPYHLLFFTDETLRGLFETTPFGSVSHGFSWDPSVWVLSIQNYLRRNRTPEEIASAGRIPGYLLLLMAASPLALIEKRRGPIMRFWAQRPN